MYDKSIKGMALVIGVLVVMVLYLIFGEPDVTAEPPKVHSCTVTSITEQEHYRQTNELHNDMEYWRERAGGCYSPLKEGNKTRPACHIRGTI